MQTLSKEDYEKSRPVGERTLEMPGYVIRAHVNSDGKLSVIVNRIGESGYEQLPLGYLLGTNALELNAPKKKKKV